MADAEGFVLDVDVQKSENLPDGEMHDTEGFVFDADAYVSTLTDAQKWGKLPEGVTKRFTGVDGEDHWEVFKLLYLKRTDGELVLICENNNPLWDRAPWNMRKIMQVLSGM